MTQNSLTATRAALDDLPAVVDLFMMVEAEHEGYNPLRFKTKPNIREGFLRWMTNNLANDNQLIAVVRDPAGNPVIPQALFHPTHPATFGEPVANPTRVAGAIVVGISDEIPIYAYRQYAYIHDLAVATSHRRRGIGTQLLHFARDWSAAKGLPHLRLMVAEGNPGAAEGFIKAGFQPTYREMILPLNPKN